MVPWFVILISQINFRKEKGAEMKDHPFKMPFAPVTNYLTIAFLIMVLIGMWFNDDTRISLVVGIIFLAIVTISFYAFGIGKRAPLDVQNNKEISSNRRRGCSSGTAFSYCCYLSINRYNLSNR